MRRESTKHNPRLDDELKKEVGSLTHGAPVESHQEEWREQEGAGDDEREPSSRTADPAALGPDAEAARAELSRHLRLSAFPGDRDTLLAEAERNHAPGPVLAALHRLPEGTFTTVYDVWEALGGTVEHVVGRPDRHSRGGSRGRSSPASTGTNGRIGHDFADAKAVSGQGEKADPGDVALALEKLVAVYRFLDDERRAP